ncbi:hypothetical protein MATL_G00072670 [Megalops atlanticus]|uniref:Uncharacterized protein n=1 Tax=Megalops atlanticus TaxID=7932 RepID=A0A9D3QA11_MEGAT|nr:hypothetical protein MATL_G00072670 [Megalops atlanticus]
MQKSSEGCWAEGKQSFFTAWTLKTEEAQEIRPSDANRQVGNASVHLRLLLRPPRLLPDEEEEKEEGGGGEATRPRDRGVTRPGRAPGGCEKALGGPCPASSSSEEHPAHQLLAEMWACAHEGWSLVGVGGGGLAPIPKGPAFSLCQGLTPACPGFLWYTVQTLYKPCFLCVSVSQPWSLRSPEVPLAGLSSRVS